jgi:hypothetical protein
MQIKSTYQRGNKATTTKGKLETIAKQIFIIEAFKQQYGIKFDGEIVGLPGPWKQCPRHVSEYNAYGFAERKQTLVEYEHAIYKSQLAWAKRFNFKGTLTPGDAYALIEKQLNNGKKYNMIDFDKCGHLEDRDLELIKQASRAGVDALIFAVCLKGSFSKDLKKYKKQLGIRKRLARDGVMRNPYKLISERTIETWASKYGFEVKAIPYRGITCMEVFVLLNVRKYGVNTRKININNKYR